MSSANDPAIVEAVDAVEALCTALRISDYCVGGIEEQETFAEAVTAKAALFAAIDARCDARVINAARLTAAHVHLTIAEQELAKRDLARSVAHATEAQRLMAPATHEDNVVERVRTLMHGSADGNKWSKPEGT